MSALFYDVSGCVCAFGWRGRPVQVLPKAKHLVWGLDQTHNNLEHFLGVKLKLLLKI